MTTSSWEQDSNKRSSLVSWPWGARRCSTLTWTPSRAQKRLPWTLRGCWPNLTNRSLASPSRTAIGPWTWYRRWSCPLPRWWTWSSQPACRTSSSSCPSTQPMSTSSGKVAGSVRRGASSARYHSLPRRLSPQTWWVSWRRRAAPPSWIGSSVSSPRKKRPGASRTSTRSPQANSTRSSALSQTRSTSLDTQLRSTRTRTILRNLHLAWCGTSASSLTARVDSPRRVLSSSPDRAWGAWARDSRAIVRPEGAHRF